MKIVKAALCAALTIFIMILLPDQDSSLEPGGHRFNSSTYTF
jgi:hypothetical protein